MQIAEIRAHKLRLKQHLCLPGPEFTVAYQQSVRQVGYFQEVLFQKYFTNMNQRITTSSYDSWKNLLAFKW